MPIKSQERFFFKLLLGRTFSVVISDIFKRLSSNVEATFLMIKDQLQPQNVAQNSLKNLKLSIKTVSYELSNLEPVGR